MNFVAKISQLDRRWVFLLVAIAVIMPQIFPFTQPMKTTPPVESIFEYIESLPEGSTVFIALDYDPASEAELYPMTLAILRHCFEKKLKVISCTLWATGRSLINRAFATMSEEYNIKHGVDYANYGFKVGYNLVVMQAGENFPGAFKKAKRQRTEDMPITENIEKLEDIDYFIDIAAGSSLDAVWIGFGVGWYNITLGGGCTAVSAAQYYPYLETGQINGLIGGLKGVAEYEMLLAQTYGNVSNDARKGEEIAKKEFLGMGMYGMSSQSVVHILIVLLVLLNNIIYFMMRKKGA
jgi:hypothetical protein